MLSKQIHKEAESMKQNISKKSISEIDGLQEYNEFTQYLEQAKEFIEKLQIMGLEETKKELRFCAFKEELSPLFIELVVLVDKLIARNLDAAHSIVEKRQINLESSMNLNRG